MENFSETSIMCYLKYIDSHLDYVPIKKPLLEDTGITYYELRQLMTIFYKSTNDTTTKKVISELLKILSIRELRKLPIPPIKKLKNISPNIFD